MPVKTKTLPLQTLRDAIAQALWGVVSANDLPSACERLGLKKGEVSEAFQSKRKYVQLRIAPLSGPELVSLGQQVVAEFEVPELADYLSELTVHAQHRVSDLTRRNLLQVLDLIAPAPLFGDVPVWEGLAVLGPDFTKTDWLTGVNPLSEEIEQHYLRNDDYSDATVLEMCGALTCSQQKFFDLLEKVVDPVCRRGDEQALLVAAINKVLERDGFALASVGEISRHPQYAVQRIATGNAGAPKNLIFAATNCKPDLYFADAINNDVAIANNSDALIYDRPLSDRGLSWDELVDWWHASQHLDDRAHAQTGLYKRLASAVTATNSPGEVAIFRTYYRNFAQKLGKDLPALIPQVYLHYDPRTQIERGNNRVLARQRMDFLMLLDHGARIVIEVDGKHHFADGDVASAVKYAEMAREDRRLRLQGYEIYRFGAGEFADTRRTHDRIQVGEETAGMLIEFFGRLLKRHRTA